MSFFDDIKDFGKDILGTAGSMFGGSIGGAAATSLGNSLFGSNSETGVNFEDVRRGHFEDRRDYRLRDKYDWRKAKQRGLTPQEFYGSPAAGGSSSSGGAQVLGNAQSEREQLNDQLGQQAAMQGQQVAAQLQQTKMQTDAQIETAKIAAGQSGENAALEAETKKYIAHLENYIKQGQLRLNEKEFNQVTLPLAAAGIQKTKRETEKIVTEIALNDKKWITFMKQLSMGPKNVMQTVATQMLGITLDDPAQWSKYNEQERQEVIGILLALESTLVGEVTGLGRLAASLTGDGANSLGDHRGKNDNPYIHTPSNDGMGVVEKITNPAPRVGTKWGSPFDRPIYMQGN